MYIDKKTDPDKYFQDNYVNPKRERENGDKTLEESKGADSVQDKKANKFIPNGLYEDKKIEEPKDVLMADFEKEIEDMEKMAGLYKPPKSKVLPQVKKKLQIQTERST